MLKTFNWYEWLNGISCDHNGKKRKLSPYMSDEERMRYRDEAREILLVSLERERAIDTQNEEKGKKQ